MKHVFAARRVLIVVALITVAFSSGHAQEAGSTPDGSAEVKSDASPESPAVDTNAARKEVTELGFKKEAESADEEAEDESIEEEKKNAVSLGLFTGFGTSLKYVRKTGSRFYYGVFISSLKSESFHENKLVDAAQRLSSVEKVDFIGLQIGFLAKSALGFGFTGKTDRGGFAISGALAALTGDFAYSYEIQRTAASCATIGGSCSKETVQAMSSQAKLLRPVATIGLQYDWEFKHGVVDVGVHYSTLFSNETGTLTLEDGRSREFDSANIFKGVYPTASVGFVF